MWGNVWEWLDAHNIYKTAVLLFIVVYTLIAVIKTKGARKFFGRFKKVKIGALEMELKDGDVEKDVQQDGALFILREELQEIKKRLDKHYKYIKEAAIQAGNSVVWSDTGVPFVEVIKAGLLNINLGANGNLKKRMVEVILGFGKEGIPNYRSLLNEFVKNSEVKISEHFNETVNWIDAELNKKGEKHE